MGELPTMPLTLDTPLVDTALLSAAPSTLDISIKSSGQEDGTEVQSPRPLVLHIGDPIRYNPETYAAFSQQFDIIRPATPERERPEFIQALRSGRWGEFSAIFRPFWGSGGEMGKWDEELIELLPKSCKVFASAGAGFDWADTKALGEKGVIYCNSGLAAAEAVADFAVAMIISTFRHLPWCMGAAVVPASASSDAPDFFKHCHTFATGMSHNVRRSVLGIVGMGNIGQNIAAKLGCPAFGMKIHYFDVQRKPAQLEQELNATYHNSFQDLLSISDCIVLCTPASPNGSPLITKETIASIKPGARFVNIARGSLVDEDALVDALESGRLSSAALDVHANEPHIHPRLLKLASLSRPASFETYDPSRIPAQVMLTCHNAGGTVETHIQFEELSMKNIMSVLDGREAITPVNKHHLKGGR